MQVRSHTSTRPSSAKPSILQRWGWLGVIGASVVSLVGFAIAWLWMLGFGLDLAAIAQTPRRVPAPPPVETLQQQRQQIDQYRSGLSQARDRIKQLEAAAKGNLTTLRHNIEITDSQLRDNEYRLKQAQQLLADLQKDLTIAQTAYQQQQAATVGRLQFLQRQQTSQGWAVLLQSQNLNEFLDRRYYLKLLLKADQLNLKELGQAAADIQRQTYQVEQQKNAIALLNQELLTQKAQYTNQAQAQLAMVERLRSNREALEAAEEQLLRDSESLRQLIQQRVGSGRFGTAAYPPILWGSGPMGLPSNGEISSRFGWRTHPILGTRRFHAGLDFAADYGSPIRAAERGVVIFSGWYGGYGNAVIIDHGNGITTLYGHASELYVNEGQTVQRGEAIAAVGSTGLSTGPHLHFEVRKSGEPVDPIAYL